jgi:hypothetical protein
MKRIAELIERYWPYVLIAVALVGLGYRILVGGGF